MIVSYRRVSTEEQDIGLVAQQSSIDFYLRTRGWTLDADFNEKRSARDMKRPELQNAITLVESTKGTLIVAKLDRLSRSVADFANLTERATKMGWTIIVVDIGIDMTTITGRLVANIMAAVAQWERDTIGLRIKEALAEKRKQGIRPGRPVSDQIALRIHDLRTSGMNLHSIADHLNTSGVPTAGGGKKWYASTVRGVLSR